MPLFGRYFSVTVAELSRGSMQSKFSSRLEKDMPFHTCKICENVPRYNLYNILITFHEDDVCNIYMRKSIVHDGPIHEPNSFIFWVSIFIKNAMIVTDTNLKATKILDHGVSKLKNLSIF